MIECQYKIRIHVLFAKPIIIYGNKDLVNKVKNCFTMDLGLLQINGWVPKNNIVLQKKVFLNVADFVALEVTEAPQFFFLRPTVRVQVFNSRGVLVGEISEEEAKRRLGEKGNHDA